MDYSLFYSKHSAACHELISKYPQLINKSVCIDAPRARSYCRANGITHVPSLVVSFDNTKVLLLSSCEAIEEWLSSVLFQLRSSLKPAEQVKKTMEAARPTPRQVAPRIVTLEAPPPKYIETRPIYSPQSMAPPPPLYKPLDEKTRAPPPQIYKPLNTELPPMPPASVPDPAAQSNAISIAERLKQEREMMT